MEPSSQLRLQPSDDGKQWVAKFLVENSGEADGLFSIAVPEGCLVSPDPSRLVLAGGSSQALVLTIPRFKRGPLLGDLVLTPRGGSPLRAALVAPPEEVVAPPPPEITEAPKTSPAGAQSVKKFLSLPEKAPAPEAAGLASVASAELHFARPHEIEIGWDIPSPDVVRFQIQRRQISPGKDNSVQMEWIPWTNLKIRMAEGKATALIENLADNTFWTIRIVGFNAAGQAGPPSVPFLISTPPAKKIRAPDWLWWVLLLALAGGLVKLAFRRRHRLLAAEDARLERLQAEAGTGEKPR